MAFHRMTRLGATLTLVAGCACGTAALATPAHADTPPPCTPHLSASFDTDTTPHTIQTTAYDVCEWGTVNLAADIYKDGTEVVSGRGGSTYVCQGTTTNTFTFSLDIPGTLTVHCG
jgi:hypothetical protein